MSKSKMDDQIFHGKGINAEEVQCSHKKAGAWNKAETVVFVEKHSGWIGLIKSNLSLKTVTLPKNLNLNLPTNLAHVQNNPWNIPKILLVCLKASLA